MATEEKDLPEMKWHNLNVGFKVSINSGAALVIYLAALFLFLGFVALFPPVEKNFIAGLGGLTVAFERYLNKRNNNNKLANAEEIEKLKLTAACPPEGGAASK